MLSLATTTDIVAEDGMAKILISEIISGDQIDSSMLPGASKSVMKQSETCPNAAVLSRSQNASNFFSLLVLEYLKGY